MGLPIRFEDTKGGKEYLAHRDRITVLEAELTQARAERDKARRALGKALDGWYDATILLLQTGVSHEDVTVRNRNKCNEARAAIKAAERNDEENGTKH